MGDKSAIQWTDATWNPTRGCSRVSEGCRHCYAEVVAARFSGKGKPYEGLARYLEHRDNVGPNGVRREPRWTGEVRFVAEALDLPLRWKRPRRIFVNSMSDLFHEKVQDEWIDRIFAVMVDAGRESDAGRQSPNYLGLRSHVFQVLTKRPNRMHAYMRDPETPVRIAGWFKGNHLQRVPGQQLTTWPPQAVWFGVSVEDQETADERIPLLLDTPAALRWVSYEPALGSLDFSHDTEIGIRTWLREVEGCPRLDWVVIGGESGPGARPFDLAWARSAIGQCRAAGVPVFVKQLGSKPHDRNTIVWFEGTEVTKFRPEMVRDRKGGDMSEWPEDLRVREYPV
jgi:protein gp37